MRLPPALYAVVLFAILCLASYSAVDHLANLLNGFSSIISTPKRGSPLLSRDNVIVPPGVNATKSDVVAAQAVVDGAIDQLDKLNHARLAQPRRNRYRPRPGTVPESSVVEDAPPEQKLPPFSMTDKLVAAAALIAEVDALRDGPVVDNGGPGKGTNTSVNGTIAAGARLHQRAEAAGGSFWMESIPRKGAWPWGTGAHKVGLCCPLLGRRPSRKQYPLAASHHWLTRVATSRCTEMSKTTAPSEMGKR